MSEANKMYEGIEMVIEDMIEEYKAKGKFYWSETYRHQDQIDCLEELKRRLNK